MTLNASVRECVESTAPGRAPPLRFAVAVEASLAPWQAACVTAMTETGLAMPIDPQAAQKQAIPDFILCFGLPDECRTQLPVWFLRFNGVPPAAGAVSFRHQVYRRRSVTLEVLSTDSGMSGPRVLHRAELRALPMPGATLKASRRAAAAVCAGAVRRIASGSVTAATPFPNSPPEQPGAARVFGEVVTGAIQYLIGRLLLREAWTIGIVPASIQSILQGAPLPTPHWLSSPDFGRFHADPFAMIHNGRIHLMFEMWSFFSGRGWIAACEVDRRGKPLSPVVRSAIDIGCHASYPAIFEYQGAIYCAPEMWESGGLHIFRMGKCPAEWTLVSHTLDQTPIVDPTIFQHEGRWWLLATLRGHAPDADLHGWYADSPFGPWSPHPLNPLKSDIRSSRPAGSVFRIGNEIYRPSQDCSAGYGGSVRINRVVRLDTRMFEEIEASHISPSANWRNRHGIHTLNVCGDQIVIDAKGLVVDPLTPLWTLLPHLRRLWDRMRRP